MRLNRLNMSARSCSDRRSLMGIFLITDRSTSLKFGPTYLLRDTVAPVQLGSGSLVAGFSAVGLQNAAGFNHCTPGIEALKLWETPANGSPTWTKPDRTSSYGWPEWKFMIELTCHPLRTRP